VAAFSTLEGANSAPQISQLDLMGHFEAVKMKGREGKGEEEKERERREKTCHINIWLRPCRYYYLLF